MIQIRNNVFETNSSSTHSITICTEDKFNRWKNGELVLKDYPEVLVKKSSLSKEDIDMIDSDDNEDRSYLTYKQWQQHECLSTYTKKYTPKVGEPIVAFGVYGNNY